MSVSVYLLYILLYYFSRNVGFNILRFVEVLPGNVRALVDGLLALLGRLRSRYYSSHILESGKPYAEDDKVAKKCLNWTSPSIHIKIID